MRADYAERGRRLLYVKSSFHVFLSNSSGDKPAAEELGRRLLKEGIGGDDNVMQAQQFLQTALNSAEQYPGPDRQNLIDVAKLALQNLVHSD
jgi:hypothetical protein